MRVLVVDDDRDAVLSLTTLLHTESYQTRGLHDANDILHHVRQFDPDVVVLDIAMPGKSGWEAAKEIRADPSGRGIVLVGLSGEYTTGADRSIAQQRGFDFYLMKPYDPKVLLTLLRWSRIESPVRTAFG